MEAHIHVAQVLGRAAVQQLRRVEGLVPGPVDAQLDVTGWHPVLAVGVIGAHPAIHGRGVLLAPEPDQPGGDEPDARIAVILLAECGDEVLHQRLYPRIAVVG